MILVWFAFSDRAPQLLLHTTLSASNQEVWYINSLHLHAVPGWFPVDSHGGFAAKLTRKDGGIEWSDDADDDEAQWRRPVAMISLHIAVRTSAVVSYWSTYSSSSR